jgi:hypothetical protein
MFNGRFQIEYVRDSIRSLQQCSIVLLENSELAIVPGSVQDGDVVSILQGTISACILRPIGKEYWILVSGDCFVFTDDFRPLTDPTLFDSDKYIAFNDEKAEVFNIR